MDVERAKQIVRNIYGANHDDAPYEDEEGESLWGPAVECDLISLKDFKCWLEQH